LLSYPHYMKYFWQNFVLPVDKSPLKGKKFFHFTFLAFANAKKVAYNNSIMVKIFSICLILLAPLWPALAATGDKADTNSDFIVVLLIFIFLINLLDFIRRIFGLGGNRP